MPDHRRAGPLGGQDEAADDAATPARTSTSMPTDAGAASDRFTFSEWNRTSDIE